MSLPTRGQASPSVVCLLAAATDESVEEVETGIDGYEIPPPWEGTPVDE